MSTKIADSKGRISLGAKFAGRMVIVDDSDPYRIVIIPAVAVPERQACLAPCLAPDGDSSDSSPKPKDGS